MASNRNRTGGGLLPDVAVGQYLLQPSDVDVGNCDPVPGKTQVTAPGVLAVCGPPVMRVELAFPASEIVNGRDSIVVRKFDDLPHAT